MCALVGKQEESCRINRLFQLGKKDGRSALIERFSLLEGLSLEKVHSMLEEIQLTQGAEELFSYAREHDIKVHVLSGNATFVLDFFAKKLGISDVSGSRLLVVDGIIQAWDDQQCKCVEKYAEASRRIWEMGLCREQVAAVGDSVADRDIFALAGKSFLINKKSDVTADCEIERLDDILRYLE